MDGSVDVVIVGGGACGTLVAAHLCSCADRPLRVALVEPRRQLAQGVAYSTQRPEHLLNVVAGRMSAFDGRPDDFTRFLQAHPQLLPGVAATVIADVDALEDVFAPRMAYARYLAHVLASQPRAGALDHIVDSVVDVSPQAGHLQVRLASGRVLAAVATVLATGNRPARLPLPAGVARDGLPLVEAWDYPGVAAIDPDADVCIVGAGLSMVDVVLTLDRTGHRGRIDVLSRHGLAPLAHADPVHGDAPGATGLAQLGVGARMRCIRAAATAAMAAGRPWQWSLDALRRETRALWADWPEREQRRFLRHAVRYWDIHRHRIAPEAAAALGRTASAGRLRLHAGRLQAIDSGPRSRLRCRARDGHDFAIGADVLVNATGMDKGMGRDGLLATLHARGLVGAGAHGIGIASIGDGAVLNADGQRLEGVWTLGSPRVGGLWESIAIPELRGQAECVAAAVCRYVTAGDRFA